MTLSFNPRKTGKTDREGDVFKNAVTDITLSLPLALLLPSIPSDSKRILERNKSSFSAPNTIWCGRKQAAHRICKTKGNPAVVAAGAQ
jgi:hypothetical protein